MSMLSTRLTERVLFKERLREQQMRRAASLEDVVDLSSGDPDLPTAPHIIRAAQHALQERQTHYTHWQGIPELRRAISQKLRGDNGLAYAPEEIVATAGAEEALYVAIMALVGPGDEVLCADPFYHALPRLVKMAGGTTVLVPTSETDGFALHPDEIERRLTTRSKVLVLITPHNPTGTVLRRDVLQALAETARRADLLVISDEIYEKILYDGAEHVSIAAFPSMRERTIVINGFSKAYSMTGFRLGYLAAPGDLVDALHVFKENLSICPSAISQWAGLEALQGSQEVIAETVRIYDERRRIVMDGLDAMRIPYARPAGGMFLFANISGTGLGSDEFCRRLLEEARVLLLTGSSACSRDGYVRISWLMPADRVREGLERMAGFVAALRRRSTV